MLKFDCGGHLDDPGKKRRFNRRLFAVIAPKYDFVTRALSFGRDQTWKRTLIEALPTGLSQARCLDLACGTGDLCFSLAARYPDARITGIDISEEMLRLARQRHRGGEGGREAEGGPGIEWRCADLCETGEPDASTDLVTGGYALRNAPDLDRALAEVARILRPGGHAAFLDFSKSPRRAAALVNLGLLRLWGGFWGLLLHRDAHVYGYIAASLSRFPDREELGLRFAAAGLNVVGSELFYGGMLHLVVVRKPGGAE